jgi:hypothetical protein
MKAPVTNGLMRIVMTQRVTNVRPTNPKKTRRCERCRGPAVVHFVKFSWVKTFFRTVRKLRPTPFTGFIPGCAALSPRQNRTAPTTTAIVTSAVNSPKKPFTSQWGKVRE